MAPASTGNDSTTPTHVLLVSALVVIVLGAAGCGSSHDKADNTPTSSSSATPASPTPDATAQAKNAAATAYVNMWDAAAATFHAGKATSPELEKWAVNKALASQEESGLYYQKQGTIMEGKPALSPKVTSIELTRKPYTAQITDCADTTHYIEVYKSTGKPAGEVGGDRHHVTTAVAQFNGESWVISEFSIDRDRTC